MSLFRRRQDPTAAEMLAGAQRATAYGMQALDDAAEWLTSPVRGDITQEQAAERARLLIQIQNAKTATKDGAR